MDNKEFTCFQGVDLTLWVRLILAVVVLTAAGGLAL